MRPPLIALFFLGILLNSTFALALPNANNPAPEPTTNLPALEPAPVNEDTYTVITFQAGTSDTSAACRISQLTPSEVQRLKDTILTPGLVGNEISAGTAPNAKRQNVTDSNTLLVPNPDSKDTAFQKEIPIGILQPSELSPLQNQYIKGPFAFGVSINDTLRAAQCGGDDASCAVAGKSLQLRNSSSGITGNTKDIYNTIVSDISSPTTSFTAEESDYLNAEIQGEQLLETDDANHINIQSFQRVPTTNLMNHVRADNTVEAGILTNCDNGNCILTLYSMFDKYFNSWFSGEMVVSTFGPTLWGQFKKMLVKSKRFNILPAKVASFNPLSDLKGTNRIANIKTNIEDLQNAVKGVKPMAPSEFFTKYSAIGKDLQIEGADVFRNYKRIFQRDQDLAPVFKDLFIDKRIISPGGGPSLEDTLFAPDGLLGKIKDLEQRKKIFTYLGKLKEYSDVTRNFDSVLKELAKGSEADRILAARGYAKMFKDMDAAFNLDMPDVFRKLPESRFGEYWVKDTRTGLYHSMTEGDGQYFGTNVFEKFMDDGDFSKSILERNAADGKALQLYRIDSDRFIGPVDLAELKAGNYPPDVLVRLNGTGEILPATPASYDRIKQNIETFGGQRPQVVGGGYVPFRNADGTTKGFTAKDFADRILQADIMRGKLTTYERNMDGLYDTAVARDWGKGGYTNILSKQLQSQENFVKNYFNLFNPNVLESGVGWTAKMYGYWWLTRGLGNDKLSIYQLPKEWTEVKFVPGTSDAYKGAYVDFFSNEGSDTGDIFQSVISKFPVPVVLGEFAKQYPTLDSAWNFLNAQKGRAQPDDLAVYLFGSESCPGCSASIKSPTTDRFDVQYVSPESVNGFFLEHGTSTDAKERGQYLQLYAHKTNVEGQMKGEALDTIDLVKARADGTTCQQVSEGLFLYGSLAKLLGANKTGAILAATESLSYYSFGMMGVFVTIANQLAIAPKMQDCVDDQEGYFASLFVPKASASSNTSAQAKADNLQKSVSENALDGIRAFAQRIDANSTSPSLTDKALHEATTEVKKLVDDAKNTNVAEAELRVTGSSSGYLKSNQVTYFWVAGGDLITPSLYSTDGKTLVSTQDGHTITLDNSAGTLTVDGQVVIDAEEADHERLATKNLSIPAIEIPQRLNGYQLSDTNQWLLTINVRGETVVQDPDLLNCIQQAVQDQSGVGLHSNVMSEAFGPATSVATDVYPNIAIDTTKNRILLGGQSPQTASGASASINVYGNRSVIVTGTTNPAAGKFQSLQLEDGSVLYKPQTNELIIWLRHHAGAVVKDTDVKNFIGTLTNTKNANTQCDEPAINLRVVTDPSTAATKLNGDNLTAGLQKNGPFQVFETDSKRFILYSKLVDGECQSWFKVINKVTGDVYDQPITSITQAEDGTITIHTADGQTHTLKFSSQNGKPVITYDGNSEVLRTAQGAGGSFYYDPNTGQYYAENAQLIPLNDNFKNQGVSFQANPDGTASGKAGDNVFVINPSSSGNGLFNIPGIPQDLMGAALVVLLLTIVCAGIYLDSRRKKN